MYHFSMVMYTRCYFLIAWKWLKSSFFTFPYLDHKVYSFNSSPHHHPVIPIFPMSSSLPQLCKPAKEADGKRDTARSQDWREAPEKTLTLGCPLIAPVTLVPSPLLLQDFYQRVEPISPPIPGVGVSRRWRPGVCFLDSCCLSAPRSGSSSLR